MAKLDIDFVLLDESVVMYGFRALMTGAQLESFLKNPVMLFMHERAQAGYSKPLEEDVVLPIGKWYDIRVEGDKLLAKPEFDDDDEFAKRIEGKVKKGYLNASSICLEPIAATDEMSLMLPGQTGPTVTKWGLLEASIVDIPNCRNALAIRNSASNQTISLNNADSNENAIAFLENLIPKNFDTMLLKLMAVKLGLPDTATEAEVTQKLAEVLTANSTSVTELTKLKGDLLNASNELASLKLAAEEAKVNNLVDGAIAAKKLAAGDRERYVKLAKADFDTTKELIDSMQAFESLETRLSAGGSGDANGAELAELVKLSGRELYMGGKFERLKALSPEQFKLKYKEYWGTDPK
jgi:hypothetical protein